MVSVQVVSHGDPKSRPRFEAIESESRWYSLPTVATVVTIRSMAGPRPLPSCTALSNSRTEHCKVAGVIAEDIARNSRAQNRPAAGCEDSRVVGAALVIGIIGINTSLLQKRFEPLDLGIPVANIILRALSPVLTFPELFIAILNILLCLLYTSPSPRDGLLSRMPSSA